MISINIKISRTPDELIDINRNQVESLYSLRGNKAFFKHVAEDFLRKKREHETAENRDDDKREIDMIDLRFIERKMRETSEGI